MKAKILKTILVVDDVKDNVEILEQFFKNKGYAVLSAYGGREAIAMAETHTPDLVLLDIMMPEMDGFEVCRVLKKERTHFKNIPIIMVTAKDDSKSLIQGLELGADDYVSKPYNIDELNARVGSALRLKQALDELKELNDLKNHFLGVASHDVKSPILRIEAAIGKILEERTRLTATQVEQLEQMKKEAHTIFMLITDLLDVTKIETGKVGLDLHDVSLKGLLEEVCKMNEMTAASKKISLHLKVDKGVHHVVADPDRLLEVFDNLMTNAIKFSNEGQNVWVHVQETDTHMEILFEDEGVGIPEAELPRVFDRFSKLSPHPTQGEHSTGLGLSICKQIVELHRGKISCSSHVGRGTTFKISLPKKILAKAA
ncbi:MAG: response regulator [Deltaproteobacteria bacterium]|nr:response regulator [Deltaproteobacteria bacterium]